MTGNVHGEDTESSDGVIKKAFIKTILITTMVIIVPHTLLIGNHYKKLLCQLTSNKCVVI